MFLELLNRSDVRIFVADAHKFYEKQGGVHTEKMFRFEIN